MKNAIAGEAVCKICGCSDFMACPGGCAWAEVDRKKGTGICSNCIGRRPLPKTKGPAGTKRRKRA